MVSVCSIPADAVIQAGWAFLKCPLHSFRCSRGYTYCQQGYLDRYHFVKVNKYQEFSLVLSSLIQHNTNIYLMTLKSTLLWETDKNQIVWGLHGTCWILQAGECKVSRLKSALTWWTSVIISHVKVEFSPFLCEFVNISWNQSITCHVTKMYEPMIKFWYQSTCCFYMINNDPIWSQFCTWNDTWAIQTNAKP